MDNYYIDENHTKKETSNHFNVVDSSLDNILRHYNIYKFSPNPKTIKRKEIQNDIDNFKVMYWDMGYTIKQLCNYYDCKEGIISRIIEDNNLQKYNKINFKEGV